MTIVMMVTERQGMRRIVRGGGVVLSPHRHHRHSVTLKHGQNTPIEMTLSSFSSTPKRRF